MYQLCQEVTLSLIKVLLKMLIFDTKQGSILMDFFQRHYDIIYH